MGMLEEIQASAAERTELAKQRDVLWAELDTIVAADLRDQKREREVRAQIKALQERLFVLDQERSVTAIAVRRSLAGQPVDLDALRKQKRLA